jgi:hypothetical protein
MNVAKMSQLLDRLLSLCANTQAQAFDMQAVLLGYLGLAGARSGAAIGSVQER